MGLSNPRCLLVENVQVNCESRLRRQDYGSIWENISISINVGLKTSASLPCLDAIYGEEEWMQNGQEW